MNESSQSPELAARVTAARATLAHYHAEVDQTEHLTDWLSLARRLAVELDGILGALEAEPGRRRRSRTDPGPGVAQPGGGWISGSSRS